LELYFTNSYITPERKMDVTPMFLVGEAAQIYFNLWERFGYSVAS
jgi:hypothetical protein